MKRLVRQLDKLPGSEDSQDFLVSDCAQYAHSMIASTGFLVVVFAASVREPPRHQVQSTKLKALPFVLRTLCLRVLVVKISASGGPCFVDAGLVS